MLLRNICCVDGMFARLISGRYYEDNQRGSAYGREGTRLPEDNIRLDYGNGKSCDHYLQLGKSLASETGTSSTVFAKLCQASNHTKPSNWQLHQDSRPDVVKPDRRAVEI